MALTIAYSYAGFKHEQFSYFGEKSYNCKEKAFETASSTLLMLRAG